MRSAYIVMALGGALMAGDDPGGWSKARWGMTDAAVIKAFDGKAKRVEKEDKNHLGQLAIDGLEIAGVKFDVSMEFGKDNKLATVTFFPSDQSAGISQVLDGHASDEVMAMGS